MKEFSFYLFFLYLFFNVKSRELEYEIKKLEDKEKGIIYNYIEFGDDSKFILNPRSEKVVLFQFTNLTKFTI